MTSTPLKNLLGHYANLYSIGLPGRKKNMDEGSMFNSTKGVFKAKITTEINGEISKEAGRGSFSSKNKKSKMRNHLFISVWLCD